MPVQSCSDNGKPGYRFGESGFCYTYTAGNESSKKRARAKAILQEVAARASGWTEKLNSNKDPKEEKMEVNFSYDDAQKIKKEHESMAAWHKSMAQSHEKVATWHADQSDALSKAMQEVPLDPSKSVRPVSPAHGSPAPQPSGPRPPAKEVPLDPMKKSEFIQILKDHSELFGDLGISLERYADEVFKG